MELVYYLHFSSYEFVWSSILHVYRYALIGCYKCKKMYIYYRVVWGGDKLNAICGDVIIVLYCGLWSGLRGQDGVHLCRHVLSVSSGS